MDITAQHPGCQSLALWFGFDYDDCVTRETFVRIEMVLTAQPGSDLPTDRTLTRLPPRPSDSYPTPSHHPEEIASHAPLSPQWFHAH
jgi:hypothetical protein